jgi:hypothetical protein
MAFLAAVAATKAWLVAWLGRFSTRVRAVDDASARRLLRPDILAFGTHKDVLGRGLGRLTGFSCSHFGTCCSQRQWAEFIRASRHDMTAAGRN